MHEWLVIHLAVLESFLMRFILVAGLALGLSPTVYASPVTSQQQSHESPRVLLRQMAQAVKHLNYKGTFVYQNGDMLSTLKVSHAWHGGEEHERLVSQDGSRREVLIDGNTVTYVRPSMKSIVIMQRSVHPGLPGSVGAGSGGNPYYRPELGGIRRVAGRSCRRVELRPVDKLRYARRMCIGLSHKLLLESEVIDRQGSVIERMLFTSLHVVREFPKGEFALPVLGSDYTLKRLHDARPKSMHGWEFGTLPPGFKLYAMRDRNLGAKGGAVRQLVLSDGVSSVSVFIAPSSEDPDGNHFLRSGALNVYSTWMHGCAITVMGEVPRETIRDIAESLSYSGSGS